MAKAQTRTAAADAVQPTDERKYAMKVRARVRCYYGGMHEEGDEFDNLLDLPTYPEDANSNIEAVQD
jgi:hypothetical protein